MKTISNQGDGARMSADAYAGFLKLWLTPASKLPALKDEVEAYIRYTSDRDPLSATARRALGQPTDRAA